MSKAVKIILGLIVLALIAFVVFVPRSGDNGETEVEIDEAVNEEFQRQAIGSIDIDDFNQSVTEVVYTDLGFVPANITISAGTSVRFVNESSERMWVASAVHPTHEELPGFDQLEVGSEYTYSFEEIGTWQYHNHSNASHTGTVTVIE